MDAVAPPSPPAPGLPEETVCLALANAQRRHVLKRLACAPAGFTAGEAGPGSRKQRNLILKHLTLLVKLAVLTAATDANDARCLRYRLAPGITTRRTGPDMELDFGCAVLRWPAGSETQPFPHPLRRQRR